MLRGIWFLKFDTTAVRRPCTTNVGLCTDAPPSLSKNRRRGEGGLFTAYTNFHSLSKASGTGKRPIQDAHSETFTPFHTIYIQTAHTLLEGVSVARSPTSRRGTLGISGWGCAAGTLEPLAYTRASSAEFCYPILE